MRDDGANGLDGARRPFLARHLEQGAKACPLARRLLSKMNMKSSSSVDLLRLPEARPARIVNVEAEPADRERLQAMGLCVGRTVEVVQAGDPVIVRVFGTRIGLAAVLARSIHVESA
jgi:Fe2+ transport system protein FeoA